MSTKIDENGNKVKITVSKKKVSDGFNIKEFYLKGLKSNISISGIGAPVCVCLGKDDKLCIYSISMPPEECNLFVLKLVKEQDPKELIFGLDRHVLKPIECGNKFSDCVPVAHYGPDKRWRVGVVDYQCNPISSEVLPYNWNNLYWSCTVRGELETAAFEIRRKRIESEIPKLEPPDSATRVQLNKYREAVFEYGADSYEAKKILSENVENERFITIAYQIRLAVSEMAKRKAEYGDGDEEEQDKDDA